jgi:hypothetical protein
MITVESAQLSLDRPNGVSSMVLANRRSCFTLLLVVMTCAWHAAAQVPNDSCATAMVISDGNTNSTNNGASTGPDPFLATCGQLHNDVWFSYTASCTGTAIASLCPPGAANWDTIMAAWSGSCGCLSEMACNDDFCSGASQLSFPVTAGTVYYISVGGFDGGAGNFTLFMQCGPGQPPPVPSNDYCSAAVPITPGVVTPGSNVNATTGGGSCPGDPVGTCSLMSGDVWYSFFATCAGSYDASTCVGATNYDSVVAVWDGSGGCASLVELACSDDNCQLGGQFLSSTATWVATANTTYYISVGGFLGATGTFDLLVNPSPGAMTLGFFDAGPGTLGYSVQAGPAFGTAYTALTLSQGAYPNDWFFGIAISLSEINSQISTGFPFVVGLDSCGATTIGPATGLPTGLTVYGVSVGVPSGSGFPSAITSPASGTVP